MSFNKTNKKRLLAGVVFATALVLGACGGGGGSSSPAPTPPSGGTPPSTPPASKQASNMTVSNIGQTGDWREGSGAELASGDFRLRGNGLTFDLRFAPDEGNWKIATTGSCDGADGEFEGSQDLQITASTTGSVSCNLNVSSDNGTLWEFTLRYEDPTNPGGWVAPSSLMDFVRITDTNNADPDQKCGRFKPSEYITFDGVSTSSPQVYTADHIAMVEETTETVGSCYVPVFTLTDQDLEERALHYVLYAEFMTQQDGEIDVRPTGNSILGPVENTFVSAGDTFGGMSQIDQFLVGSSGGPGLSVGGRTNVTGMTGDAPLAQTGQLSTSLLGGGGNQEFFVEFNQEGIEGRVTLKSVSPIED